MQHQAQRAFGVNDKMPFRIGSSAIICTNRFEASRSFARLSALPDGKADGFCSQ